MEERVAVSSSVVQEGFAASSDVPDASCEEEVRTADLAFQESKIFSHIFSIST